MQVDTPKPSPDLTSAQKRVLFYIGKGLTNKQIGREIGRSDRTVEHHVLNALEKLGLCNRTQLALTAAGMTNAELEAELMRARATINDLRAQLDSQRRRVVA